MRIVCLFGLIEQTCITVNKSTDPQTDKATGNPVAAMCVRKSSVRRVLQFTPFIGASSVLHRPASRVIHRLQLYCIVCLISFKDWFRVLDSVHYGEGCVYDLFPRARSLSVVSRVEAQKGCRLWNTP